MPDWKYGNYAKDKAFNIRSASYSLTAILIIYYAIVLFHLPFPFIEVGDGGVQWSTTLPFLYGWFFFATGAVAAKGGYLLKQTRNGSAFSSALSTVLATSVYLVCFQGIMLLALIAVTYGPQFAASEYFQRSHLFWAAVALLIALYPIPKLLNRFDMVRWQTLTDLRALPFVSPAFCFGLPVLLSSNVSPLQLDTKTLGAYVLLSFTSGVLFIAFLIFFAVANRFVTEPAALDKKIELPSRLIASNTENRDRQVRRMTNIGFVIIASAIYLVMLAVLDLLVVASLNVRPADVEVEASLVNLVQDITTLHQQAR